jgi:hypothetical protein
MPQATEGLLQFHPHIIRRGFVLTTVDDLAENEGVLDFEFEGGTGGDRALELEPNTARGDVPDPRGEPDIGFTEESNPNRFIRLEAQFPPFVHNPHIGCQGGEV